MSVLSADNLSSRLSRPSAFSRLVKRLYVKLKKRERESGLNERLESWQLTKPFILSDGESATERFLLRTLIRGCLVTMEMVRGLF